MARQFLVPGGSYVNLAATGNEFQAPGDGFINDESAAGATGSRQRRRAFMDQQISKSLGKHTSTVTLYTGRITLKGVGIQTDGTNNATVTLYDNTAASGKILFEAVLPGANRYEYIILPKIQAEIGLHMVISGIGASCIPYVG